MKRKNIIFLSLVAVVILTLVLIAFFVQMHPIEIRYFTDISSFSALEPYVVGNLDAFQEVFSNGAIRKYHKYQQKIKRTKMVHGLDCGPFL